MCTSRSRSWGRRLVVASALWLVLLLSPRTGRAQACCTATGSSGFGVVGRCYFAVLATQLSYERGYGTFDSRGRFSRLRNAEVDDFVVALGGGVRLGTPALQLHGSIPLRMQYRDLHGLPAASAVGFGDASLMLRAMAVEDRMTDSTCPGRRACSRSSSRSLGCACRPGARPGIPPNRPASTQWATAHGRPSGASR